MDLHSRHPRLPRVIVGVGVFYSLFITVTILAGSWRESWSGGG